MRVLALDTSTRVGTVAVVVDDVLVFEVAARVRESHGESILPWVDRAVRAAGLGPGEIDLVAYCRGPGSFTGVRIGLAAAKGLAIATGVPILGVSSLRALAHALEGSSGLVCPILDARKHEVYAAAMRFDGSVVAEELAEHVASPEAVGRRLREIAGDREVVLAGEGARTYESELLPAAGAPCRIASRPHDAPRGSILAHLAALDFAAGAREDPAVAAPVYLRPPDAEYKPRGPL